MNAKLSDYKEQIALRANSLHLFVKQRNAVSRRKLQSNFPAHKKESVMLSFDFDVGVWEIALQYFTNITICYVWINGR